MTFYFHHKGYELGFVSQKRYDKLCETTEHLENSKNQLKSISKSLTTWRKELEIETYSNNSAGLKTLVQTLMSQ